MALLTKIQRFCTHDGPGIRTAVFFKGCPLRCKWCHNPETQSFKKQVLLNDRLCIGCGQCAASCPKGLHKMQNGHVIDRQSCVGCFKCCEACCSNALEGCGFEMSPDEILRQVLEDSAFYGKTGGITLSGGEPMAQPDAAVELLSLAKAAGMDTAVETCGFFDGNIIPELASVANRLLYDFKDSNDLRHKAYTGVSNQKIISNLVAIDKYDITIRLRCIMVNGVNMDIDHYKAIAELYHNLQHCEGVELIAYHAFAGGKNLLLGQEDASRPEWIPTPKQLASARKSLRALGVKTVQNS